MNRNVIITCAVTGGRRRIVKRLGAKVATPTEARDILGLGGS